MAILTDELVANLVAAGGVGVGAPADVTLNNAAVLGLDSVAQEIVPAPGSGLAILPTKMLVLVRTAAGAYTVSSGAYIKVFYTGITSNNVTDDNVLSSDLSTASSDWLGSGGIDTTNGVFATFGLPGLSATSTKLTLDGIVEATQASKPTFGALALLDNLALNIKGVSGLWVTGGGNVANKMRVLTWFMTVPTTIP